MQKLHLGTLLMGTLILGACSGGGHASTAPPTYVPSNSQRPGTFADLTVYQYDLPGASLPASPAGLLFSQGLQRAQWQLVEAASNQSVTTSSVTSVESTADALFFNGHGSVGTIQFSHAGNGQYPIEQQEWGPAENSRGGGANISGMPINNRLHWIIALSSDTVAGSQNQDPNNPGWTTNWDIAFGGSLHGLYGFWQSPGYCYTFRQANPTRSCDVTTLAFPTVGSLLPAYLTGVGTSSRAQYVHDAWIHTASDAGMAVGWSIWEDTANRYDVFTGPGGITNQTPSGRRQFYYGVGTQIQPASTVVNPDAFPLRPVNPGAESINDQALAQTYQPYVSTITSVSDGITIDSVTSSEGIHVKHNTNTGAISYHGINEDNPINFTQDTALSAATAFVQNSLGMPSDAALQPVALHRRYDQASGSDIVVGYEFTWVHTSDTGEPIAGDAIRVIVNDDLRANRGACISWEWTDPDPQQRPRRYCAEYSYTYTDIPDISYAFRMWHRLSVGGGLRSVQSAGRSTGDPSIDAYTASLSLPPNTIVTGYQSGYWGGTFDGGTGGTAGQPAWLFTLGGGNAVVAVDAFSGEILGQVLQ